MFLTAPFNITSNTLLEVDNNASIVAVANATADWPVVAPLPWYGGGSDYQMSGQPMYQSFIRSFNADNITLTGGGTIDGSVCVCEGGGSSNGRLSFHLMHTPTSFPPRPFPVYCRARHGGRAGAGTSSPRRALAFRGRT